MYDLTDVTSEAMIEELKKRHDAILIVQHRDTTPDVGVTVVQYFGSPYQVLGLAEYARIHMQRHIDNLHDAAEDDDDDTDEEMADAF